MESQLESQLELEQQAHITNPISELEAELDASSIVEPIATQTIEYHSNELEHDGNLEPDVRVGFAIYLLVLNEGKMTEHGALLPNGLNMPQIANQSEVSVNYAIKAAGNLRKQGFIRNRREDGRLLVKMVEIEEWLTENGAVLD